MSISDLIQPRRLSRRAVIYVRHPHQVMNNQESQHLQYALTQRAVELGWHEQDIQVIDTDLGITATVVDGRQGFQQLVADVALSEIGILIAYEAQRLARNCTHWYQLLDLCGHTDCLIADRDGVIKHPDREVQSRVSLVFEMLLEKTSLAQLVRCFNQQELKIPRRDRFGDIQWKRPTVASLGSMVKNPAYAGAFAYGRTRSTRDEKTGKNRQKVLPIEQWKVCIREQYPAYISWDTFEKIYDMLRDNYSEYDRNKTRGVPRDGKALLHGIAYCGECGHKLVVQYKGGTQYLCNYLRQQHGEPVCQRLPGDHIDAYVLLVDFGPSQQIIERTDAVPRPPHAEEFADEELLIPRVQMFTDADPDFR